MFGSRKKYSPEVVGPIWTGIEEGLARRIPGLRAEQDAALAQDHWPARQTFPELVPVLLGFEYHSWECDALNGFLTVIRSKARKDRWIPDDDTCSRMQYRNLEARAEYMSALVIASRLFNADRDITTADVMASLPSEVDVDALEAEADAFQEQWRNIRARTRPPSPTREQHQHEVMLDIAKEFGYRITG